MMFLSSVALALQSLSLRRIHAAPRCRLVGSAGAELHREVQDRGSVLLRSSTAQAEGARWDRVELRTLPGKPGISCTFIDRSARISRRYAGDEIDVKLTQLLEAQRWQPPAPLPAEADSEADDADKSWLLGAAPPAASAAALPFLSALELKQQARKLKQIQAFLRAMFDVGPHGISLIGVRSSEPLGGDLRTRRRRQPHGSSQSEAPLLVVDYGCGAAFLTFALHHVLAEAVRANPTPHTRGRSPDGIGRASLSRLALACRVLHTRCSRASQVGLGATGVRSVGVDRMGHLVERHRAVAEQLGWRMCFADGQIGGFSAARTATEAERAELADASVAGTVVVEESGEIEGGTGAASGDGRVPGSGGGVHARRIDVAVALHACDTATDEALVEAVSGGAQLIYAAPCCHQQLQRQLREVARAARHPNSAMLPAPAPAPAAAAAAASSSAAPPSRRGPSDAAASFDAATAPSLSATAASASAVASPSAASLAMITSDNLIRQRIGDTLTDTLRASLLRLLRYRVDVVEFVDIAHSPKNLLIRAVRDGTGDDEASDSDGGGDGNGGGGGISGGHGHEAALLEYRALTAAWGITPHLELLLARRAADIDARAAASAGGSTEGGGTAPPPNEFELELAKRVRELGLRG